MMYSVCIHDMYNTDKVVVVPRIKVAPCEVGSDVYTFWCDVQSTHTLSCIYVWGDMCWSVIVNLEVLRLNVPNHRPAHA